MGISLRIFVVNDDESIKRFPLSRFERLLRGDPKERLPEHAGKRVKYAEAAVELENRKPTRILRIVYHILSFDSEGRLDQAEQEKERRLVADIIAFPIKNGSSGRVIKAQGLFAKKRFEHHYRWTPTESVEMKIVEAVFHVKHGR
jgi:hypothetical protein